MKLAPRRRLILRAAIGTDDVAVAAWRAWRSHFHVAEADEEESRLLTLIAYRLQQLDLGDPEFARIEGLRRFQWAESASIRGALQETLNALEAAGVESMVFKGVALLDVYPNTATRTMHDVDLLVPGERLDQALSVLQRTGWQPFHRIRFSSVRHVARHLPGWNFKNARGQSIDLHWRPLHGFALREGADARLWAGRRPCEVAGIRFCRPAPAHHVALLLGHGLRFRSGAMLQSLVDTAMALRSTEVDVEALRAVSNEYRLSGTVRTGLSLIAEISHDAGARALANGVGVSLRARCGAAARLRGPGRMKTVLEQLAGADEKPVASTPSPRRLRADDTLDFRDADVVGSVGTGWWPSEEWGSWSVGRRATVGIELDADVETRLLVLCQAFTTERSPSQTVHVRINGARVARWDFAFGEPKHEREVALPDGRGRYDIEFRIARPRCPTRELGYHDDRLLGLGVTSIRVEAAMRARARSGDPVP